MVEQNSDNNPDTQNTILKFPPRYLRVKKYPISLIESLYSLDVQKDQFAINEQHMLVAKTRQVLDIPAQDSLEMVRKRIMLADSEMDTDEPAAPKPIQEMIAWIHNLSVVRTMSEDPNHTKLLIADRPHRDKLVQNTFLLAGVNFLLEKIDQLPAERKQTITLLDIVDTQLLLSLKNNARKK